MRQGSVAETPTDTLAFNILLAHTGDNLGNVNRGSLGSSVHHRNDIVALVQRISSKTTGILTRAVELLVDLGLEGLKHGLSRLRGEQTALGLVHDLSHILLRLRK